MFLIFLKESFKVKTKSKLKKPKPKSLQKSTKYSLGQILKHDDALTLALALALKLVSNFKNDAYYRSNKSLKHCLILETFHHSKYKEKKIDSYYHKEKYNLYVVTFLGDPLNEKYVLVEGAINHDIQKV